MGASRTWSARMTSARAASFSVSLMGASRTWSAGRTCARAASFSVSLMSGGAHSRSRRARRVGGSSRAESADARTDNLHNWPRLATFLYIPVLHEYPYTVVKQQAKWRATPFRTSDIARRCPCPPTGLLWSCSASGQQKFISCSSFHPASTPHRPCAVRHCALARSFPWSASRTGPTGTGPGSRMVAGAYSEESTNKGRGGGSALCSDLLSSQPPRRAPCTAQSPPSSSPRARRPPSPWAAAARARRSAGCARAWRASRGRPATPSPSARS